MRTDLEVLARRYRLGRRLEFVPTPEYARDVLDMVGNMDGKPRAHGRDENQLARSAKSSRALEYVLTANVPGTQLIPWVPGRLYGADVEDTYRGVKIDVKSQFWGSETWEPQASHLRNLMRTYAAGEVDFVLTGHCQQQGDRFVGMFLQLIPVELIFRDRPPRGEDDVEGWLSPTFMERSEYHGEHRYYFKNRIAVSSGSSARFVPRGRKSPETSVQSTE